MSYKWTRKICAFLLSGWPLAFARQYNRIQRWLAVEELRCGIVEVENDDHATRSTRQAAG